MRLKILAALAFLATILMANYLTSNYGLVPVGFGLVTTAGTYAAGLAFVLRDSLQDSIRRTLPDRVVYVEDFVEIRGHRVSQGTRTELAPPLHWSVAWRTGVVVVVGAALSFALASPAIALASGTAFLLSELLDLGVYTPLRDSGYLRAAVASNLVGSFVDTVVFLTIAGFPVWSSVPGQMVAKMTVTALTVGAVVVVRAIPRHRLGV